MTILGVSATNKALSKTGVVGNFGTHMLGGELLGQDMTKSLGIVGSTILSPLNKLATATDNAIRTGVYKQSIKEGSSAEAALERAFEVINFRRAGSSPATTFLRQTVPFFGAYLQAFNVVGKTLLSASGVGMNRSLSPSTKQKAITTFWTNYGMAVAGTVIYTILMHDEEEYEDMYGPARDRRYIIGGTGHHITLRNDPFTFMAKIVPEYMVRKFYLESKDNRDFMQGLKDALIRSVEIIPVPHIISVASQFYANKEFRTGRPVVPQSASGKTTDRQYTDRTAEFAKILGDQYGLNPIKVDKFINMVFGYTGGFAMFMTNELFADMDSRDLPEGERFKADMFSDEWWQNLPGMSGFIHRTGESPSEVKRKYYDMKNQIGQMVKEWNDLNKNEYDRDKVRDYRDKHIKEINIGQALTAYDKEMNAIRKRKTQLRDIKRDRPFVDSKYKAEELKRLALMEKDLLSQIQGLRDMAYGQYKNSDK